MRTYRLIRGSSHNMEHVPDVSTTLIFTSPPYYRARDYSVAIKHDIGRENDYEKYLAMMLPVWEECYRVLKPGGFLAVNIDNTTVEGEIYPCAIDVFHQIQNYTNFHLKENIYWIKQPQFGDKRGNHIKRNPYPRYYYPYRCVEPIYIFQKPGKTISRHKRPEDKIPEQTARDWAFNTWNVAARDSDHPASFPEELAERMIRLYTETGEIVGDPFAGSGTVMAVAKKWRRSSWGYEVNSMFVSLAMRRLTWGQASLFDGSEAEYEYLEV